jgi:hypothetical protein
MTTSHLGEPDGRISADLPVDRITAAVLLYPTSP